MIHTLYVDDDPLLLDLAKEFLEGENEDLNVTVCTSAREVIGILRNKSFDVIISDYQMPIMSGIELLKELRGHGIDIPFILFTGKGREEVAIDALNNGADFYLNKGGNPRVQFTELMNLVRHMVLRRQAIDAVKHNAEKFRAMIENSLDIITIINPDGTLRYASPSVKKVLGHGTDGIVGRPMTTLVHAEDQSAFNELMNSGNSGTSDLGVFRLRRSDGEFAYFEGSFTKMKEGDGSRYTIFNGREITKRHKAEERLRESEELYRSIFESSASGMVLFKGGVMEMNSSALRALGYTKDELEGRGLIDISSALQENGEGIDELLRNLVSGDGGENGKDFTWIVTRKDGRTLGLRSTFRQITVGSERQFLISFVDESGRREVEARASINEETCRTLLLTTTDAVLIIDGGKNITYSSPKAGKVLGRGPDLIGLDLLELADDEERDQLAMDIDALMKGVHTAPKRYHFTTKDGAPIHAELSASRVMGPNGTVSGLVCIFHDVTGNVLAEGQAISANRHLSEVTDLLRIELQKRITAISGQLQLLQFMYKEEGARSQVDMAMDQAAQATKFLEFAKSYSAISSQPPQWSVLRDLMDAAIGQACGVSLTSDVHVNGYDVYADVLIGNAFEQLIQHMLGRDTDIDHLIVHSAEEKGRLLISIEDNGVGYSPYDASRLFEIDARDMSGHGLNFVKEVVRASGMSIEAVSLPKGLRIVIVVPPSKWRNH